MGSSKVSAYGALKVLSLELKRNPKT